MCPLRTKCICVDARQQAVVQKGPRGCRCWAGQVSEVDVMVAVYLWMIFFADSEDRFWYGEVCQSKFVASSRRK